MPVRQMPRRRYFSTNDPVMTPDLLDYFFNQRTQTFQNLSEREKELLNSIYNLAEYQPVLPVYFSESDAPGWQRKHQRYSLKCPGIFSVNSPEKKDVYALQVVEFSDDGFLAYSKMPLPINVWGEARIRLGSEEKSIIKAMAVHGKYKNAHGLYGFKLVETDLSWRKLVGVLEAGATHEDLDNASRFLPD